MNSTLDIRLAGFNVDAELLNTIPAASSQTLTPETLSAAYARISRSAAAIPTLRRQAREEVSAARRSNSRIIFDMGHHSIAEHAVFNFDIMNISRLAMEEIEGMRLVSFTEKSQRYVKLEGDTLIPEEINDPELRTDFSRVVAAQNRFYEDAVAAIEHHLRERNPRYLTDRQLLRRLRGSAQEDARYGLSLATRGQLGMTINARNLELLLRRTELSRRREVQEVGRRIFALVQPVAPSLILFPRPSAFDCTASRDFPSVMARYDDTKTPGRDDYILAEAPLNGDERVLAAFLSRIGSLTWSQALERVRSLDEKEKGTLFRRLFGELEFFDALTREFELPDFTFDLVVSASCYAQLKRHRMATLLTSPYRIDLGVTVPDIFAPAGVASAFQELRARTDELFLRLQHAVPGVEEYILTNAHRRRVIMKMNFRELAHFIRLRADEHAQWEIRRLAGWMLENARRVMPHSSMLVCGKSDYAATFNGIFKKNPRHPI